MARRIIKIMLAAVAAMTVTLALAGPDRPTDFTNQGGITNTRHNMTQRSASGADLLAGGPNAGGAGAMDANRNNYGEVCVYCHTPHGANSAAVPLWNRSLPAGSSYTLYSALNTTSSLTQVVEAPGAASLPCLSCHDGSQAIDAIINMPGSGQYNATPTAAFADTWGTGLGGAAAHLGLSGNDTGCLICHQPGSYGAIFQHATDFTIFAIGTDLRNDHPVGVNFPVTSGAGTDWNTPGGSVTRGSVVTRFFDETNNGRMDKGDIRLYGSGSDARVECASCHDPHGVPSSGADSSMFPTFLRKTNTGSAVCLTCHNK